MSTPTTTKTAIDIHDVACAIGQHTILSDVNFTIPQHARVALVGTNGAGKSTLLRVLAGVVPAAAGEVRLAGRDLTSLSAPERAKEIAFVSQEESPSADLLLHEVVALGRVPHRKPWSGGGNTDDHIVSESLAAVELLDLANRPGHQLSGGQRRRAMIARGLAQRTPVLMLDEPTNHLDIKWQMRLLDMLTSYDGTVVVAIHDLDLVYRYFTHVAIVHDGTVTAFGDPKDVLTAEHIRTAFGVDLAPVQNPTTGQTHLLTFPLTTS